MTPPGSCCIVLHGHLPYVHHPDHEDFLEEDWYFEAVVETYLPLLHVLDDLSAEDVPVRMAVGLTPTLLEMFRAPSLAAKFEVYMERRGRLAASEVRRLEGRPLLHRTALHYAARHGQLLELHRALGGDLPAGFRRHMEEGRLEILASAATHPILPLLATAQVKFGGDPSSPPNPDPKRLMSLQQYVNYYFDPQDRAAKLATMRANALTQIQATKDAIENTILVLEVSGLAGDPEASALLDFAFPDDLRKIKKALCEAFIWIDEGQKVRGGVSYPGKNNHIGLSGDLLCEGLSVAAFPGLVHEGGHLVNFPGWGNSAASSYSNPELVKDVACAVNKYGDEVLSFLIEKYFAEYQWAASGAFGLVDYCAAMNDAYDSAHSYWLQLRAETQEHINTRDAAVANGTITPVALSEFNKELDELAAIEEDLIWTVVKFRQCLDAHGCN